MPSIQNSRLVRFLDELLINTSQYGVFYVLMNLCLDRFGFIANIGHVILLGVLLAQTYLLVLFGHKTRYRVLYSLLAPFVYSVLELREGLAFVFNTAHFFFWFFSLLVVLLQLLIMTDARRQVRYLCEFLLSMLNVASFIFIYFYFDAKLMHLEHVAQGMITNEQMYRMLEFDNLAIEFVSFLSDSAHLYILLGGLLLSLTISISRIKVLVLKERIRDVFGRYVDNSIRDMILDSEKVESRKKQITILFSDIRNFTRLSESNDAQKVTLMLNLYFEMWVDVAHRHGGVVDKFIGDAVMILFDLEGKGDGREKAVACSLEALAHLEKLNATLSAMGLPRLDGIGIGIDHGEVILGDIGSFKRKNFTVIGDHVNIAARLEAKCKDFATSLTISPAVHESLDPQLQRRFHLHAGVLLKGKNETMDVFVLRDPAVQEA